MVYKITVLIFCSIAIDVLKSIEQLIGPMKIKNGKWNVFGSISINYVEIKETYLNVFKKC